MSGPARACGSAVEAAVLAREAVHERPLATNALWLFASHLVYVGCQWGAVVTLAKIAPPASLGHFGLALAVTNPIIMVTGFSLRSYQSSDVLGRYRFVDYVNLRLAANVVAGTLIGAIVVTGAVGGPAGVVLVPIAVAKLADATSETCYGLAQKHGRMPFIALSKAVRGALGLAALALVVVLGGSVAEGAWALAAVWTAFLLLVDFRAAAGLEPVLGRSRLAVIARLLRETAPLGAVCGIMGMIQSVPRFLLQVCHGAAAVGYYTALASVGPVLSQFAGAVGNASSPRLGWALATDTDGYHALVRRLLAGAAAASLLFALLAAVAGRDFLRLAYTEDYTAYWGTFVLVALAAGFGIINSIGYHALIAARRVRLLLGIQCVALIITTAGGLLLVPRAGLAGAALAAAIGAGTTAALGAFALLRVRGRP